MFKRTHENLAPLRQLPGEPHFDDALTILKARQVVPLKQFDEMLQRKWFLVGMFVLTMFLGAVSGLISAYFKLQEVSETPVFQLSASTVTVPEDALSSTASPASYTDTENGSDNALPELAPVEERQFKLMTPKRAIIRQKRDTLNTKQAVPLSPLSEKEELRRIREGLLTEDLKKQRVRSGG